MAENVTTTRPARKRAPVAAKAAAPTTAKATDPAVSEEERERYPFAMKALDPTRSYNVFEPPVGSGCVGKLYVPKGCEEVKVLLLGPGVTPK